MKDDLTKSLLAGLAQDSSDPDAKDAATMKQANLIDDDDVFDVPPRKNAYDTDEK